MDNHHAFYQELERVHEEYFANLRFSQLMARFLQWLGDVKQIENFLVIDDDTLIEHLNEFVEEFVDGDNQD